jgi:hypothetical protein
MSIIIMWHNLHLSLYSSVDTTRRLLYRCTEHCGYHVMSRRVQAVCTIIFCARCDDNRDTWICSTRFNIMK